MTLRINYIIIESLNCYAYTHCALSCTVGWRTAVSKFNSGTGMKLNYSKLTSFMPVIADDSLCIC